MQNFSVDLSRSGEADRLVDLVAPVFVYDRGELQTTNSAHIVSRLMGNSDNTILTAFWQYHS